LYFILPVLIVFLQILTIIRYHITFIRLTL